MIEQSSGSDEIALLEEILITQVGSQEDVVVEEVEDALPSKVVADTVKAALAEAKLEEEMEDKMEGKMENSEKSLGFTKKSVTKPAADVSTDNESKENEPAKVQGETMVVPSGIVGLASDVELLELELSRSQSLGQTVGISFVVLSAAALIALLTRRWYRTRQEKSRLKESRYYSNFMNYTLDVDDRDLDDRVDYVAMIN